MKNEIKLTQKLSIAIFAVFAMAFRCGGSDEPMPTEVDSGIVDDAGFVDGGIDVDGGNMIDGGTLMLGYVTPSFLAPPNFTEVPQGTIFRFAASGVTIVPKTDVGFQKGYFVLAIDASCTPSNTVAPQDARHLHLIDGESEIALSLPLGMHVMCLQVASADGRVYIGSARLTTYMY